MTQKILALSLKDVHLAGEVTPEYEKTFCIIVLHTELTACAVRRVYYLQLFAEGLLNMRCLWS